jgi:lipopolysaccharide export system protein LptA
MSKWLSSLCLSAGVLFIAGLVGAEGNPALGTRTNDHPSTTITAKKMTVRNQESKAVFEGAVVLMRGGLVVHSDKMVVSFKPADPSPSGSPSPRGPASNGQNGTAAGKKMNEGSDSLPTVSNRAVRTIEATGHVRIEKEGGSATCQKAVYFQDEEKIVMTGDPVAWQRGTRVAGRQITMFLAEDRSVVEGGSHVTIEGEAGTSR